MTQPPWPPNRPSGWISLPSIPAHRVTQGFLAFLTAIVIAAAVDAVMITHNHRPETWQLTAEMVFDDGSSIIAWSLPATWPLMEVFRMVLAGIYEKRRRDKFLAEGVAKGIAIGEARVRDSIRAEAEAAANAPPTPPEPAPASGLAAMETHQRWLAWNLRRLQTEARNDIFTEPPPAASDTPCAPTHRRWLEWNIRRLEAATDGAPFPEPPPPLPTAG